MEYVILGLLLFKPMTAYEISGFVRKNLALVCSGSAGSVQVALKKLLKNGSVRVNEFVEGSVNKRRYSITEIGKKGFQEWVESPMQAEKVKNMELSKLFFLGFAEKEKQIAAIEDYIGQLQTVRNTLLEIKKLCLDTNFQKLRELEFAHAEDVTKYQSLTLDYGIDSAEFEINWYQKLLRTMEG